MPTPKPRNTCRVCLNVGITMNIFSKFHSTIISEKIMSLANVEIHPDDGLPDTICKNCVKKLNHCVKFIQLCKESEKTLRASLIDRKSTKDDNKAADISTIKDITGSFDQEDSHLSAAELLQVIVEEKNTEKGQEDRVILSDKSKIIINKKVEKQQCFTCGKIMSSKFRLKTHLRIHSGERPFSCSHCDKTFALAQNLKIHLRIHTGEKPLKCSECDATFAHTSGLKAHILKHTGQMPYCCQLCPKKFRTFGHLQYHVRRHTGEKNFECDNCGRAFITQSQLKQHLLSHGGERPHCCCVCGLRVTRASHLRRHMELVHNPKKTCANKKTHQTLKVKLKDDKLPDTCKSKDSSPNVSNN